MKLFHTTTVRVPVGHGNTVKRTFNFKTAEDRNAFISTAYLQGLIEPEPALNCDHLMTVGDALTECRRSKRYYAETGE